MTQGDDESDSREGALDWWHIADSRTGLRVSVTSYFTQEQAERQINHWRDLWSERPRDRDAVGGRPDIHELMPYLVAREGP